MTEWKRNCPKCNKLIIYKKEKYLLIAIMKNAICKSCAQINNTNAKYHVLSKEHKRKLINSHKKLSSETKNKISYALTGRKLSQNHKNALSKLRLGKKLSEKTKNKLSIINKGRCHTEEARKKIKYSWKNRQPMSNETRIKIRKSIIKKIEELYGKNKVQPFYNPKACQIIDEYGKKNGYNFQHAMNGGEYHIKELCYWVDGYDKEKNVVIEYYEVRNHKNNVEKDERRKQEIINHLNCEFIEIKEWELYI